MTAGPLCPGRIASAGVWVVLVFALAFHLTLWAQSSQAVSPKAAQSKQVQSKAAQYKTLKQKAGEIAVVPPQVPVVQLSVDKNPVQVTETVTLTLAPASLVVNSPFVFTFAFGDGSQSIKGRDQAGVAHQYRAPGTYTVSVSLDVRPGSEVFVQMPRVSNSVIVQVESLAVQPEVNTMKPDGEFAFPKDQLRLAVDPTEGNTNDVVVFTASTRHTYPNIRYQFTYGDGEESGWLDQPRDTHVYKSAEKYTASAEALIGNRRLVSNGVAVVISPPPYRPPPDDNSRWYLIAIVAVALAVAGYLVFGRGGRSGTKGPLPEGRVVPHSDMGSQRVKIRTANPIRVEVRVRPASAKGKYKVLNQTIQIIKNERRKQ